MIAVVMDLTRKSYIARIPTTRRLPNRTIHSKIHSKIIMAICIILLLLISNFTTALEELGPVEIIEPLDGPGFRAVGWQWHYIDQNGDAGRMTKIASSTDNAGNELASYERSDGCQWTRPVRGFAPALQWSNCPSTGKAGVTFTEGNIWPLRIGNTFTYKVRGSSNLLARAWGTRRQCNVTSAVRIKIVSGEYDTYKVVCKERFGTRTWWLSPAVGTAVAYQHQPRRGDLILQEFTHIESGSAE